MNVIKYKIGKYLPSDLMSELICENYQMLLVVSRFGIDLGFGEESIEVVCKKSGVDVDTFLAVANLLILSDRGDYVCDGGAVSLPTMMEYLKQSHRYYLEYRLPAIRRNLVEALGGDGNEVSYVVVKYYDEYVAEVRRHMMYEEDTLFPYINAIINGSCMQQYSSSQYSEHHEEVAAKLSELKSIIIKYCPVSTTNALINVLYDVFSCERDLVSHNDIEDLLLVPALSYHEANR